MGAKELRAFLERLERNPNHDLSFAEWLTLLNSVSRACLTRGLHRPVAFTSYEHQIEIYQLRAKLKYFIKHPDDTMPPQEGPSYAGDDVDSPDFGYDAEGGPGFPAPSAFARPRILAGVV